MTRSLEIESLGSAGRQAVIRPGTRRRQWGVNLAGYLFVSPALLLFLVFIACPLVAAVALAFFKWDLLTDIQFAGVSNFVQLVHDPVLLRALGNTFLFAVASVVTHIGLGMLLALAVNRKMSKVVRYWVRTTVFFPFLISWAAVSLLWKYVLDPNMGILSYYLSLIGVHAPTWLLDPKWALPSLIGVDWWHTIGYTFVILLAGLQTVPNELHEAAMVDGANASRRFWSITLPLMSPTLFFATIITFIGAFQIFDPMFIMTDGGPGDATRSVVQYTFQQAFRSFNVGYGSAVALVVFVVIALVTALQFRLSRRWVHQ
jgi:ABC-type sugar transport system permease subunit